MTGWAVAGLVLAVLAVLVALVAVVTGRTWGASRRYEREDDARGSTRGRRRRRVTPSPTTGTRSAAARTPPTRP